MSQQLTTVNQFEGMIAGRQKSFDSALPMQVSTRKFMRACVTAFQNSEDLQECVVDTVISACTKAACDGLLLDGREAALVSFNKNVGTFQKPIWQKHAQYMPMVTGIMKKARNSGQIASLSAAVVYAKDQFDYELGFEKTLSHKPFLDGDPGEIRCAYAVAVLKDGTREIEVMRMDEIMQVARSSKSGWDDKKKELKGVWKSWFSEMARKTVLKRLCKYLPSSSDLDDLIQYDNKEFNAEIDITPEQPAADPAPAPKKKRTRAKQAIVKEEKTEKVIEGEVVDQAPAAPVDQIDENEIPI